LSLVVALLGAGGRGVCAMVGPGEVVRIRLWPQWSKGADGSGKMWCAAFAAPAVRRLISGCAAPPREAAPPPPPAPREEVGTELLLRLV
jgi:hypothetical protein